MSNDMKEIFEKLKIPEPSADLEIRIIASAGIAPTAKSYLPRFAVIAACMLVIFSVWTNNSQTPLPPEAIQQTANIAAINYEVDGYDILSDIEFFDEDEFVEDIG
ncbi:MAG: hypothetical protein COV36_01625 [Alphaproteobacteria bacterium CG11_big_fil_rev_8_21_14_0_20_44_7]|nr:MAG: hypothetical protein COV36_01625 [Alphaproteobacteria bacterium CG11_big_fil_rev_8_21_14_0_20_44_7]